MNTGRFEVTAGELVAAQVTTEKLWTVRETADFLSMSVSWVYKQVEANAIPHAKLGGALRFHPQRIREYAARLGGASAKVIPLKGKR